MTTSTLVNAEWNVNAGVVRCTVGGVDYEMCEDKPAAFHFSVSKMFDVGYGISIGPQLHHLSAFDGMGREFGSGSGDINFGGIYFNWRK